MRTRWACSINFCELRRVEWTNTEQINVLRPVSPPSLVVSIQARRDAQTEYLYYLQLYCRNTPPREGGGGSEPRLCPPIVGEDKDQPMGRGNRTSAAASMPLPVCHMSCPGDVQVHPPRAMGTLTARSRGAYPCACQKQGPAMGADHLLIAAYY